MNCEEFELRGLDLDRLDFDPMEAESAAEHARICTNCGALLESWREVKSDLRLLREATRKDSAPMRVEMRLKQELRTRREARVPLGTVAISAWALAVAAVLIAAVSWVGWQRTRHQPTSVEKSTAPSAPSQSAERPEAIVSEASRSSTEQADPIKRSDAAHSAVSHDAVGKYEDGGKFTLLPGILPSETEETAIVRVRLQRGALGTLGLPVNEERAGEWIQVDLLVGNDGLPQAVRLAR